jgi:hypothetical protein
MVQSSLSIHVYGGLVGRKSKASLTCNAKCINTHLLIGVAVGQVTHGGCASRGPSLSTAVEFRETSPEQAGVGEKGPHVLSESLPGGNPVQDPDDDPEAQSDNRPAREPDQRPVHHPGLSPEQYWKTRWRLEYIKLLIWIIWFLVTGDTPDGLL